MANKVVYTVIFYWLEDGLNDELQGYLSRSFKRLNKFRDIRDLFRKDNRKQR